MITALFRRLVAATAGAVALVGTSAAVASAVPLTWDQNHVSALSLLTTIVFIPIGIAGAIALIVWTYLTAKERKAGNAPTASVSGDNS